MIGIYKITNTINNKSYIGQSTNIEKRWNKHKTIFTRKKECEYDYPLYRAFRKYGLENFSFSVIEECKVSELDEKEIFWIDYYDTYYNGYNQTLGGSGVFKKLDNDILNGITLDLLNSNLSLSEISEKYHISYEMVQGINTGRHWKRDINYPIRKYEKSKKTYYCIDCGKEITSKAKRCVSCHNINVSKNSNKPSKDILSSLIIKYPLTKIGEKYNVTDNTIRKWCKSYELPYKFKDIKLYKELCIQS